MSSDQSRKQLLRRLTHGIRLVAIASFSEQNSGGADALSGSVVGHLNRFHRTNCRLHQILRISATPATWTYPDCCFGHVAWQITDDDFDSFAGDRFSRRRWSSRRARPSCWGTRRRTGASSSSSASFGLCLDDLMSESVGCLARPQTAYGLRLAVCRDPWRRTLWRGCKEMENASKLVECEQRSASALDALRDLAAYGVSAIFRITSQLWHFACYNQNLINLSLTSFLVMIIAHFLLGRDFLRDMPPRSLGGRTSLPERFLR